MDIQSISTILHHGLPVVFVLIAIAILPILFRFIVGSDDFETRSRPSRPSASTSPRTGGYTPRTFGYTPRTFGSSTSTKSRPSSIDLPDPLDLDHFDRSPSRSDSDNSCSSDAGSSND